MLKSQMLTLIAVMVPLVGCSVVLVEQPGSASLNAGLQARDAEEYSEAISHFEQSYSEARQNIIRSRALRELGLAKLYGRGGAPDASEGQRLLQEAHAMGDDRAQELLENYHENEARRAEKQRLKEQQRAQREAQRPSAAKASPVAHLDQTGLEKEAQAGNAEAMRRLGYMAQVKGEMDAAMQWYRKAAEAGDAEAQYIMGSALMQGEGIAQDTQSGQQWLDKARAQGFGDADAVLPQWGQE